MQILGLIPARGGSKAVPRKNLAVLGGKPLLSYTCDAAKQSQRLTQVIISTDDPEIANFGQSYGFMLDYPRPEYLCQDDSPMKDVIEHIITMATKDGVSPEIIVLLQPTSPLRTATHIDEAIDLLVSTGADTVVSVKNVPHRYSPTSLMRMEGESLKPYLDDAPVLRRQDKPLLYARNGPAILAFKTASFHAHGLYGGDVRPYEMDHSTSLDIDHPEDLAYGEFLLHQRSHT